MKVLALLFALATPGHAGEISADALDDPARFGGAQVVLLGEVHDNPLHHAHQARAVASLQPKALVFEMLTAEQAARMPSVLPDAATLAASLNWDAAGWPDFALYYPIFAAAPKARVYGAEVPRDVARKTFDKGIAAQFGAKAAAYGLTTPLAPKDQAAREAEQMAVHCDALPPDLLPGMVAVQRLRDAVLARAVVQALEEIGGPVAVITGTGHARRDQGLVVPLGLVAPDVAVLAIGQFEETAPEAPPFDLWLVTPPAPRDDPCAAFKG